MKYKDEQGKFEPKWATRSRSYYALHNPEGNGDTFYTKEESVHQESANPDFESASTQRPSGLDTDRYIRMNLDPMEPLRMPKDFN
jgi:hypothetical protein